MSACFGKGNLMVTYNKFIQGFIIGYFKTAVVENDPRKRMAYCRSVLNYSGKTTHAQNKRMAIRIFNSEDIIMEDAVFAYFHGFTKQDDMVDAIVQAIAYYQENK